MTCIRVVAGGGFAWLPMHLPEPEYKLLNPTTAGFLAQTTAGFLAQETRCRRDRPMA